MNVPKINSIVLANFNQIKKELRNELGDMIDRLSSALSGCALGSQQNTLILQQAKHKVEQLDNIAEVDELSSLLNNLSL